MEAGLSAHKVTILKTENGGENWISQSGGVSGVIESIFFIDENTGWAVGTDNIILENRKWWKQLDSNRSPGQNLSNNQLTSVFFTDHDHGFIAGWSIFLTTD